MSSHECGCQDWIAFAGDRWELMSSDNREAFLYHARVWTDCYRDAVRGLDALGNPYCRKEVCCGRVSVAL